MSLDGNTIMQGDMIAFYTNSNFSFGVFVSVSLVEKLTFFGVVGCSFSDSLFRLGPPFLFLFGGRMDGRGGGSV